MDKSKNFDKLINSFINAIKNKYSSEPKNVFKNIFNNSFNVDEIVFMDHIDKISFIIVNKLFLISNSVDSLTNSMSNGLHDKNDSKIKNQKSIYNYYQIKLRLDEINENLDLEQLIELYDEQLVQYNTSKNIDHSKDKILLN